MGTRALKQAYRSGRMPWGYSLRHALLVIADCGHRDAQVWCERKGLHWGGQECKARPGELPAAYSFVDRP